MLKFSDINAFKDQLLEPPCRKGFTLSELLMALTIVGVIAVLTVPVMMNNIHNKMFATQVKNMVAMIEQLAQDQLIVHRTRDLSDTDFGDPEKLLTDKHFAITKNCSASTATKDCWKIAATGKDKVQYKYISGSIPASFHDGRTLVLKNGVIIRYTLPSSSENQSGDIVGKFFMDINGNEKPNIAGRDLFGFYITNKGKVVDQSYASSSNDSLSTKITKCRESSWYCFGALVDSGWKMDY